jgi:hypothetical protein
MPTPNEKQRKLFGAALAAKRGESEPISKKVADIAKNTSEKELSKMASKPKKTKKNEGIDDGAIHELFVVKMAHPGCTPDSLVAPIDPLNGISGTEITPDQVHGVYPSADVANMIAEKVCMEYEEGQRMLEEKKGSTTEKLKKAIDKLEKKRKEHMDAAKEDPKNASEHKTAIADLATKIDDYITKLEKIEKSKKEIEKKEDKKDKK